MKILLVHPSDSVEVGTWTETRWDLVVDLGWSGRNTYLQQSERLGCRVLSIYDVLDHEQHRRRMRELLALGLGQLVDSESIDWWDAYSVYPYQQLELLMMLAALAETIPEYSEIFATRPDFAVRALSSLLTGNQKTRDITCLTAGDPGRLGRRIRRYSKAIFAFRPSQLAEIAFDKWDTDYRVRRLFGRRPTPSAEPAILLPSAYVNVSRAQVAYARMLPHRRFLLVVTRNNGRLQQLPDNVEVRSLASYAIRGVLSTGAEQSRLEGRWREIQNELFGKDRILSLASRLHLFDGFTNFLKRGLRVREAWRQVFNRESIEAVLSADENNPYTRLPTWLARSRDLRTVFCDHGALNAGFAIRKLLSDVYIVRGDMARDYCIESNGLPAEKIVVGSPKEAQNPVPPANAVPRDWIVFYSEAYELSSGRTSALYGELLPELCRLAQHTGRKVIVKLHPFESLRVRRAMADRILTEEHRKLVVMREGPMTPDLFIRAWCSFTVESSVAVESTVNGVPCFLCDWFDASWYGYGKQYAKYSAGYPLDSPRRIREIPAMLDHFEITQATRQNLQSPISAENLNRILSTK